MTLPLEATCSCCQGLGPRTPGRIENRPGLSAITHRVGTHGTFKASLLAALSRRDVPALGGLGTRDDDDYSIAMIDSFAVMADILTFYTERIANENFLRTATERRSISELARLIGYELAPGLAAETHLAFTIDPPLPGSPEMPVPIAAGARVQSVPGPEERPQTFETVDAISAQHRWNELRVQTIEQQAIGFGQRELVLRGANLGLAPGDVFLIVGDERLDDPGNERWDARVLRTVDIDATAETTRITWLEGLGSAVPRVNPAAANARAFVFRQRAALFGHNAPDPRLMSLSGEAKEALVKDLTNGIWKNFELSKKTIDLDQSYPKVVPDSWILLVSEAIPHGASSLSGYAELYQALTVGHQSISAFGLASKATRVGLDSSEHLDWFSRRETLVLGQSEELPIAARPVRAPVYGDALAFAGHVPGLSRGQALALTGPAQHIRVTIAGDALSLTFGDGTSRTMSTGDRLALAGPPELDVQGARVPVAPVDLERQLNPVATGPRPSLWWSLRDRDGRVGTANAAASAFVLDPALADAPGAPGDEIVGEVSKISALADAIVDDRDRTSIRLADPTRNVYERASLRINANVASATHGETVSELLGSGDGSVANQRIRLRQEPLTYVGSESPSGRRSTLQLRVDGALWEERDSLFNAPPGARAFEVQMGDGSETDLLFGDGREGARLPTGQGNIRATYRKGIGAAGNVRRGQLTSLLARPTGVRSAANPEPAVGGTDPEPAGQARRNAPRTVLTLGRAVSRKDYEDFAAAFAGVAKATALWVPFGPQRGMVVTVAGPDGTTIPATGEGHDRLVDALRAYGDQTLDVRVLSYARATFDLGLLVKVDPGREVQQVVAEVRKALLAQFDFNARDFGQGVAIDEIAAVCHGVVGVIAIDVTVLRRSGQPGPDASPRLHATPTLVSGTAVMPAEILTIDPAALELGAMA